MNYIAEFAKKGCVTTQVVELSLRERTKYINMFSNVHGCGLEVILK